MFFGFVSYVIVMLNDLFLPTKKKPPGIQPSPQAPFSDWLVGSELGMHD